MAKTPRDSNPEALCCEKFADFFFFYGVGAIKLPQDRFSVSPFETGGCCWNVVIG